MNEEVRKETKKSKNQFELEGNVANINEVFTNQNGKKALRFDLAQNDYENTIYIPIILRGELVNTYGNEMKKGDWIAVKGKISTYQKDVEKDGKTYKDKVIVMTGFEVTDKKNNKVYTSDGKVSELTKNNESKDKTEMER